MCMTIAMQACIVRTQQPGLINLNALFKKANMKYVLMIMNVKTACIVGIKLVLIGN